MILAELELFHSRPIAPTRRVALGHLDLPVDPAPGLGGLLLGAVVAAHAAVLDPEHFDDLDRLAVQIDQGQRIPQPRLRHRLQTDRVGLLRSRHALVGEDGEIRFDLDDRGSAAPNVLAAVYAAGRLPASARSRVITGVRRAMRWGGQIDRRLIAHLTGVSHARAWSARSHEDPVAWALGVLDLPGGDGVERRPARRAIQRRFRELLLQAHPDQGGESAAAAVRISELNEARRILLAG